MRHEVTVSFDTPLAATPFRIDLTRVDPMPMELARSWLDDQFTLMGCEPLRPTGKLLTADKVLVVAQAAGPGKFADTQWTLDFARASAVALGRPRVAVDVGAMSVSY